MKSYKVLFIVILFLITNSFLFSQEALKKGIYSLGGEISFSYSKNTFQNETAEQTNFSLAPSLNYFVIDNLLIGGIILFQYSESKFSFNSFDRKYINRQIGIGPAIRYYFSASNINPFIGGGINYFTEIGDDFYIMEYKVTAGLNLFLSKSAAIEPYLAYSITTVDSDQDVNRFVLGIRMNYFIVNN
jgi:hypothetical protein